MRTRRDVVVVGAGVVGLSIAFQLAQRGASVTVLDRAGIGAGASGVQPGGVRQQWGTRVNCLLARESMGFYADARELLRMRVDPGFRACGYLFLAHSDSALARLRENVVLQNELDIPSRIVCAGGGGRARAGSRHRERGRRRLVRRGRVLRPAAVAGRGLRRAWLTCRSAKCSALKTRALFAWLPVASCTPMRL